MALSPTATYELSAGLSLIAMSIVAAIVIAAVRVSLRWWKAPWPKLFLAHLANLVIQFLAIDVFEKVVPLYRYNGFVNGTMVAFCLGLLLADGARLWLVQRFNLRRQWPIMLFAGIFALTLIEARLTADAARGRATLDDMRWWNTTLAATVRESPGRELLPVMGRTFPREFEPAMDAYMAAAKAANPQPEQGLRLPKFPVGKVASFLALHRRDITQAPTADLANMARSMAGASRSFANIGRYCRGIDGETLRLDESYASGAASAEEVHALAVMMAAGLVATRAGIDHPTPHRFDATRSARLMRQFNAAYPDAARLAARPPGQCLALAQYWRWMGTLPPDDAAYLLATGLASTLAPSGPEGRAAHR